MKISFRQGIVRYQADPNGTPQFLSKSSNDGMYIDLRVEPDPTVLTFAHGKTNYSIEETVTVKKAWGPFLVANQTEYLYWDIDKMTGVLTRGTTLWLPITGAESPGDPELDQHWFDTTSTSMRVWTGVDWSSRIRLFAGAFISASTIVPAHIGTQADLDTPGVSGKILFDDTMHPIHSADTTFLTTETVFRVSGKTNSPNSALTFEPLLNFVTASEFIPQYFVVTVVAENTVALCRSTDLKLAHGIVTEDMYTSDVSRLISGGLVHNELWTFQPTDIGRPLFSGLTGELTLNPPSHGSVQMIGSVVSRNNIMVNIGAPIFHPTQH